MITLFLLLSVGCITVINTKKIIHMSIKEVTE